MDNEERAFRRLITETVVGGPEPLSRREIHDQLGISGHMVAEARRANQRRATEGIDEQHFFKGRDRCVEEKAEDNKVFGETGANFGIL